jgi:hypothetical protein
MICGLVMLKDLEGAPDSIFHVPRANIITLIAEQCREYAAPVPSAGEP